MPDHAAFNPIYDHEVLDVHHHIGSAVGSLGWSGRNETPPSLDIECQGRLEVMNAGGVRQAIIHPAHNYLRPIGSPIPATSTTRWRPTAMLNLIASLSRSGVVQPQDGLLALEEVDRMSDELGLAGVSFHTLLQGVSVDSAFVRMTMERLGERGMLPFVHAVTSNPLEALWRVGAVARDFPELQILVVDALSDFASTIERFTVADQAPNLVFDTTFAIDVDIDIIEDFVARFGASRLTFGTDQYSPRGLLGRRVNPILPSIVASEVLSDTDKELILAGNARALLDLPAPVVDLEPVGT